jgi:hypothetical protein
MSSLTLKSLQSCDDSISTLGVSCQFRFMQCEQGLLSLQAVEMYGLGNWGEVAEHVGTKSKTLCFDHYMTTYMNSTCSPLPVHFIDH